jgi:hypothetical protein
LVVFAVSTDETAQAAAQQAAQAVFPTSVAEAAAGSEQTTAVAYFRVTLI